MKEQSYNISLQTPLGKKQGKMLVKFHGEYIDGNMELLKQNMPFSGNITANGECVINGQLISLMRTIEYVATGKITKDNISLNLRSGKFSFVISGVASMVEGDDLYE